VEGGLGEGTGERARRVDSRSVTVINRPLHLPELLEIARELRRKQTPAEEILWALLRRKQCLGLKFRRQQQIGTFIVDFYCHQARLVIEVDGGVHSTTEQAIRDQNRDIYLREHDYLLLRFTNQQLFEDPENVLREIARVTGRWWEPAPARR